MEAGVFYRRTQTIVLSSTTGSERVANLKHCSKACRWALGGAIALVFASVIAFGSYREVSTGATSFEHRSQLAFDNITSAADVVEGVLVSLGVPSTGEADLARTAVVAQAVLSDYRFVTAMGRYQWVAANERASFESGSQAFSGRGLWQFEPRFGDDVSVVRAEPRKHYLPVLYATGRTGALGDLVGMDLGAVPSLRKPLGDALKSDTSSVVGVDSSLSAGGELWVLGGSAEAPDEQFGPTGHWVELDLRSMIVADFEWPGATKAAVDLIARSFEFDESAAEPVRLMNESVGRAVEGEFALPFLEPHKWTGVFDVGGHTLRANFEQTPAVTWQNLLLNLLLAFFCCLLVLSIFILNLRRRVAVRSQQAQVAKLHRAQQQASVTLASIRDTVITISGDGLIVYANAAAADLLKLEVDSIVNQPVAEVLKLSDDRRDREHPDGKPVSPDFLASEQSSKEFNLERPGGELIAVSQTNSPLYDLNGERSGNVLVLRDVSVERELTAALLHQANHDPLTGIANRLKFERVMSELFASADQSKWGHTLCFIDLDQFKLVNDTCGHAAGDELLIELVAGLRRNVREHDLIARLGGDEFAIVIRDCSAKSSEKVVQRVYSFFQSSHFQHSGKVFPVRASVGYVHFKPEQSSVEELLLVADAACYEAKRRGRNQVFRVSVGQQKAKLVRQGIDVSAVKNAISTGEFSSHSREISSIDGELLGVSVQIAIEAPDGDVYCASELTSLTERHGLTGHLDNWILNHVIAEHSCGQQSVGSLAMISLCSDTLSDARVLESMHDRVVASGNLTAGNLCVDIGEEILLKDLAGIHAGITNLHAYGYKIAVTCFAASISSISSLAAIPVDFIRIDLAQSTDDESRTMKLLSAALGVAHAIGAQLIVQNIRDTGDVQLCGRAGVRWVQWADTSNRLALKQAA